MFKLIKTMGFVSMLLCFKLLSAQDIKPLDVFPLHEGNINYNEVIYLDSSISSDVLYLRTKKWAVDNFGSGKSAIQIDDKSAGVVIIKGFTKVRPHNFAVSKPEIWFKLKIETKQGRYRYELYDLRYTGIVKFMSVREDFDFELTDWVGKTSVDLPKKQKKKVFDYLYYVDSLNVSTVNSLKEAMIKTDNTTW